MTGRGGLQVVTPHNRVLRHLRLRVAPPFERSPPHLGAHYTIARFYGRMSTILTTRHQTQIVVSPDSDDEERDSKAYVVGPSPLPLSRTGSHGAPLGSAASGLTASGTHTSQEGGMSANPLSHKYPHTRSALVGIIREYRPDGDAGEYGDEADGLLQQVVGLLRDENEDELKSLMKNNLDIGDDAVSGLACLMHGACLCRQTAD